MDSDKRAIGCFIGIVSATSALAWVIWATGMTLLPVLAGMALIVGILTGIAALADD